MCSLPHVSLCVPKTPSSSIDPDFSPTFLFLYFAFKTLPLGAIFYFDFSFILLFFQLSEIVCYFSSFLLYCTFSGRDDECASFDIESDVVEVPTVHEIVSTHEAVRSISMAIYVVEEMLFNKIEPSHFNLLLLGVDVEHCVEMVESTKHNRFGYWPGIVTDFFRDHKTEVTQVRTSFKNRGSRITRR